MFVETTRFGDVTLRFGVDNLFNPDETRRREFYADGRAGGALTGVETRNENWGQTYRLSVAGSF